MKSITISGSKRESVGKKSTKALRNAGLVPCVIYGGDEPIHFSAEEKAFKKLVYTPDAHTVVLDLGKDGKYNTIAQDMQWHPVRELLLHADFYQIFDDKMVTMEVPVILEGVSKGVLNGGVLRRNNRKLKVKALPANLPDSITIDITSLKIGNKRYVRDLRVDEYEIMHPDSVVVVMIKTSRTAVAEDEDGEVEAADVPSSQDEEATE
ncbi:50S ribosomal protein L25 [Nonlabens sp. MB-3u-79]|jgi:large subunit ribosomal protein L25|uniref:50S ribosomal protein L25/general stress protein Ctc n=1 Tax=Nonlabens sp. MB-3u-79 TaxID=2058134 RepID=UPI000C309285|nr:50S ribosomal protein L25/general stress protein Ctc [Nonlabens sp. MB-3u-79]AUC78961.1 50S ribosomal protein L25 [Nonlabens sp. MB-3u-79]|tara:strand:+ start:147354 stop:147977 length:624 start_codon:yes stop_codon:yes gene_type:complete